ncbi:regulatory protein E2 [Oryctolagus cuniculus papillomavirus 1]|uniref:Regulatory protein E2 n=1 Tax=Oryctolagus cuniculus papillomavirus 1 TaxID=2772507 RepID=Q9J028_9PAPI|nr:regulatory protein E2 [Oryctolagus cuniculus papillomavirus 1]AAF67125.1 regulatory protein E2 [Oryctolagus cuniculus papillomavirus 1]
METLSQRLDSVQEQLLNLYEKESQSLQDQIAHWNLIRKEQVILHFARKHGIRRLGMTYVPTLAATQHNAKQAIEIVLFLESLQRSQYGQEPWTLQDTSKERFKSPPSNCFKKGAQTVEVIYDGNKDNNFRYTVWKFIYFWDESGDWHKVPSTVDEKGVYYRDTEGNNIYYVDFETDAARFSSKGEYEVVYKSQKLSVSSVTSSTPLRPIALGNTPDNATASPAPAVSAGPAHHPQTPVKSLSGPVSRYGRRRSRSPGVGFDPARSRRQGKHPTDFNANTISADSTDSTDFSPAFRPPTPSEVGRRNTTAPRESARGLGGRVRQLISEARDPPVICLKGGNNQLKCLRYRLKAKHRTLFDCISTTWSWVDNSSTCRVGSGRVLIKFKDEAQRERFLEEVPIPRHMQVFVGNFFGL